MLGIRVAAPGDRVELTLAGAAVEVILRRVRHLRARGVAEQEAGPAVVQERRAEVGSADPGVRHGAVARLLAEVTVALAR
jgi:hypothetical protein